ncbi:MAG TPA: BTAD domain-containing putative transcriptional regulator [Opitutaceae bacterium]
MPSGLQIRLFGDFRLLRDGELVATACTSRMRSLLAYMGLHRRAPQTRSHVAFLFWPDSSEQQALTNLRHLLHKFRHAIPETGDLIGVGNRTLQWNSVTTCLLDVAEFESALEESDEALRRGDQLVGRMALERAADLYEGDLLPGCYDEWIEPERERLRRQCAGALERLVRKLTDARDYPAAVHRAGQWRQLEPTREVVHATLMRLHMLAGDRAATLQVYRECVNLLKRELDVPPGQEVRELHEHLLAGWETDGRTTGAGESSAGEGPELPLHGRNREWKVVREAWNMASRDGARVLLLLGEAGIGKSRLAEELYVWVRQQGGAAARTRSYAAEGQLAYAPAAQWLRSEALRSSIARMDTIWLAEVARILPEIRLEHPGLPDPASEPPDWRRHHLFEALARAVLAGGDPVLLVLDDMQWTDQETLQWLRFVLRFAPAAPLLLAGTVRSEELDEDLPLQRFITDLRRDGQLTEIELGPLSDVEAASVAADVAGRKLSRGESVRLYAETEGNPLFVVETVRAGLQEHGGDRDRDRVPAENERMRFGGTTLPPKVHTVINTRLAQLSAPARELAGMAAVIGRAFSFELLLEVCGRPEEEVAVQLDELWQRRIVLELGNGAYDFTHDKLREVAYLGIVAPLRRIYHRRAAEGLKKIHAVDPDSVMAQVAAHLEVAVQPGQAIDAYRRAAAVAKRLHSNEEAIRLFQKALALLEGLPPTLTRVELELKLNTELGVCLVASHGYPARGVWGIYERARDLCRQLGRPTEPPILRALAIASLTTGDLKRASALGGELLTAFANRHDSLVYVEGHYVLGVSDFWLGRFSDSRGHLEQAIARYDPRLCSRHISLYAQDPETICLSRLAWTLWYLGHPGRAVATLESALARVRELHHPHSEAYVLFFGSQLFLDLREERRAVELLEALQGLTRKHTLSFWEHRAAVLRGLLRARQRGEKDGFECAREFMADCAEGGNLTGFSQFLGYAAQVHLQHGAVAEGMAAISEAFDLLGRIDERYYNAELHRLRGELLLAGKRDVAEAEGCFQEALRTAREQEAKSLELRAAMSLARLWRGQHREKKARDLLEDVSGWFSEGHETLDLAESRALLDELR